MSIMLYSECHCPITFFTVRLGNYVNALKGPYIEMAFFFVMIHVSITLAKYGKTTKTN